VTLEASSKDSSWVNPLTGNQKEKNSTSYSKILATFYRESCNLTKGCYTYIHCYDSDQPGLLDVWHCNRSENDITTRQVLRTIRAEFSLSVNGALDSEAFVISIGLDLKLWTAYEEYPRSLQMSLPAFASYQ